MNFEHARFNMIEQQIRPWNVLDETVLATLGLIRRERFVPEAHQLLAFADTEIPLGQGEYMMPPRLEGRMLQALNVQPTDVCLEVGTGSGYVTACLAHLAKRVDSVDIHPEFTRQAETNLAAQGVANAVLHTGDALGSWTTGTLYNVIAVTGSLPEYSARFEEQLAPNGRLFMITGMGSTMQALLVTRQEDGSFVRESLFETSVKSLVGTASGRGFVF